MSIQSWLKDKFDIGREQGDSRLVQLGNGEFQVQNLVFTNSGHWFWSPGITGPTKSIEEAKLNIQKTQEWLGRCRAQKQADRDSVRVAKVLWSSDSDCSSCK